MLNSAKLTIFDSDLSHFVSLTDELTQRTGESIATEAERFTLLLRFAHTVITTSQTNTKAPVVSGPFAAILGSHQRPPQPEKSHVVLRNFVGINTQKQLADIRRWNPDADDAWIRKMAVDAVYYQLEPTVQESNVERQIEIIRTKYGYDVSEEQLLAIGVDQLHYEWSAA